MAEDKGDRPQPVDRATLARMAAGQPMKAGAPAGAGAPQDIFAAPAAPDQATQEGADAPHVAELATALAPVLDTALRSLGSPTLEQERDTWAAVARGQAGAHNSPTMMAGPGGFSALASGALGGGFLNGLAQQVARAAIAAMAKMLGQQVGPWLTRGIADLRAAIAAIQAADPGAPGLDGLGRFADGAQRLLDWLNAGGTAPLVLSPAPPAGAAR
jgi:hypothetical protein